MRNYLQEVIRTPLQLAYKKQLETVKRASIEHASKQSSLRQSATVGPSMTENMKNAELDAYADVAKNLMHDKSYGRHDAMINRHEWRQQYGDKTKFVTKNDGSEVHITKVRAKKRKTKHEEVINVDVDEKDLSHYFPVDKRAYNNGLDIAYTSKMQNVAPTKSDHHRSSALLEREVGVDTGLANSFSATNRTNELPYLFNKAELKTECLRMLIEDKGKGPKIKKLLVLLSADRVNNEEDMVQYNLLCTVSNSSEALNLTTTQTVETMLLMFE